MGRRDDRDASGGPGGSEKEISDAAALAPPRRAAGEQPPPLVSRRALELEDFLLAGWVLALEFLLGRASGSLLTSPVLLGLALAGVGLCVFSRGPEDGSQQEMELRRAVLGVPASLILFGLVLDPGAPGRLGKAIVAFLALSVIVNAILHFLRRYGERLPAIGLTPRRLLVAPAQLLGVALFERQLRPDLLQSMLAQGKPAPGRLVLLCLATLLLYWSAVVGPRILAGGSKSPLVWGPRFLVYLASVAAVVWREGQW